MTKPRGTTAERGYGSTHQAVRASWEPTVKAGRARCTETICLMRTRAIRPDEPWDLAHNRTRTGYLGPAHARCNRAEAGRRGTRAGRRQPRPVGSSYAIRTVPPS